MYMISFFVNNNFPNISRGRMAQLRRDSGLGSRESKWEIEVGEDAQVRQVNCRPLLLLIKSRLPLHGNVGSLYFA